MSEREIVSCFVSKLQHFLNLTIQEQEILAVFEKSELILKRGDVLFQEGSDAEDLFVVKSGWMYSLRYTEDGKRQIMQIRHPGDLCGMHDLMLRKRSHTLVALESCVVCPFPRSALMDLARTAPRVAMLISAIGTLDQAVLFDLLQAIARSSARDRVLHLLLQLIHRLGISNVKLGSTIRLPMNQTLIGDLLGLSNVSVSKSIGLLEQEGIIRRSGGSVTVLDCEKAGNSIGYTNRYADMEITWLR